MKFVGIEVKENDKGYFGIRRCELCKQLRDVKLIELYGQSYLFFIPIKKLNPKRFLVCEKCGACFEISEKLWNYYKEYYPRRFDKKTTDSVVAVLNQINSSLVENNVNIKITDPTCKNSLDMIYQNLCKTFGNQKNIEEIMSVYFD